MIFFFNSRLNLPGTFLLKIIVCGLKAKLLGVVKSGRAKCDQIINLLIFKIFSDFNVYIYCFFFPFSVEPVFVL